MENILVIRLKAIGDIIFTLPAIAALRARFPAAKITFLTSRENMTLLRGFSQVQGVIVLDRAALRSGNPVKMSVEFFGLLRRLRAGRFTHVVDFQGFGETAWMARITGARERWGSVYGKGRSWAYTHGLVRDDQLHPADWNLRLLAGCGISCRVIQNEFVLPADVLAAARRFFTDHALDPARPTLVLQPFTSTAQKNWPLENFLAVARHWRAAGVQVIWVGGPAEAARMDLARAEQFCVATNLPLLVSAGLVRLATLTLGGDTGLGHLAVAQGRRVLMLMMHKNSSACIPYQHPDWAMVPKTSSHIQEIGVPEVIAEMTPLLKRDA